jgi:tRNA threonylcarbamoyl adenosine modification protein (Sua5/YciO/YrdC/YwlC family)
MDSGASACSRAARISPVVGLRVTVSWMLQKVAYDSRNELRCSSLTQYFELHPVTPQARLIRQAADIVRQGGVIAYPTDSCYALGWHIGDKTALERVRRIRRADRHHHFTLVCADLAEVGRFARLETWQFRLLKACLPGPYTFLLRASRETPRRLQHEKRRTIGVRVPSHPVPQMLLRELGEPLMSSTLILPDPIQPGQAAQLPLTSGQEIRERLGHEIDAVLDGGDCGIVPTTVVDLSVSPPVVVREGRGRLDRILGQRP